MNRFVQRGGCAPQYGEVSSPLRLHTAPLPTPGYGGRGNQTGRSCIQGFRDKKTENDPGHFSIEAGGGIVATFRECGIRPVVRGLAGFFLLGVLACNTVHGQVPKYSGSDPAAPAKGKETAVLAGGCFWGVDAVFKHVKGVKDVVSGFSGGNSRTAEYETVSTGRTGHAESVKITYRPIEGHVCPVAARLLFRGHGPHPVEPPGTRRGNAVPLGDLLRQRRAEARLRSPTSIN